MSLRHTGTLSDPVRSHTAIQIGRSTSKVLPRPSARPYCLLLTTEKAISIELLH